MKYSVTKKFTFEMAHNLETCVSEECKNIHGHSYKLFVTVEKGELNKDGMVIDFKELKRAVTFILDEFDHQYITIHTYGWNPTAENMAAHIFAALKHKVPMLKKIQLWETETCMVEVQF